MTQTQLAEATGINRALVSRLETEDFTPSVDQLLALSEVLGFNATDVFMDESAETIQKDRSYKVAVAGTGYVGLSLAVLLAQHNSVTAVDIVPEKVEKLNKYISPIQDEYIEKFLKEAEEGKRTLHFTATTDGASAYKDADYIIIAAPTNYNPKKNFFDCSAVEAVLTLIKEVTADKEKKPVIVIKSTIPVGYTVSVRKKFNMDNIIFSPEFLRESKAHCMTTCIRAVSLSDVMRIQEKTQRSLRQCCRKAQSRIRSKHCSWAIQRRKPQSSL